MLAEMVHTADYLTMGIQTIDPRPIVACGLVAAIFALLICTLVERRLR